MQAKTIYSKKVLKPHLPKPLINQTKVKRRARKTHKGSVQTPLRYVSG
jgi:hypothetical protein